MKIALINPPFETDDAVGKTKSLERVLNVLPPMGIAYVAAYLEQHGYEIKIFDGSIGIKADKLIDMVAGFNPDVAGLTSSTPAFRSANDISSKLKVKIPGLITIIGGAHVTAMPSHAMNYSFDVGVIGEGEIVALDLIRHIKQHGLKNLEDIKGIAFKKESKLIINPRQKYITDLDALPLPARHLLPPLSAYRPTPTSCIRTPLAVIMSSRGCPSRCVFCDRAIFGGRFRARSADNVMREVEEVIYKYGAKEIRFFDDTFTLDKKRVYEICNKITRRKIKIPWTCLTRTTSVDEDLLRAMKKAGCWQVLYGIEAADDETLKRLRKGATVAINERAIRLAKKLGLSVRADFIMGIPGNTLEQMWRSVEFAKKTGVDYAYFNKFIPFPGSELHDLLVASGHSFNFEERSTVIDHATFMYIPEGITKDEMKEFLDKANKEFYFRFSYIIKRLLSIRTLTELKGQIDGFFAVKDL